jgi:hypothetical protein
MTLVYTPGEHATSCLIRVDVIQTPVRFDDWSSVSVEGPMQTP